MYVSRLVYIMALLEAVLWIQPNFALSWQHDMTKLLQTQTDNLNQLAQNVAKDNIASALFQKQAEIVARELEMVARANVQIRNSQTELLDKGAVKQTTSFNPTQNLPQMIAKANGGGDKGNQGTVSGENAAAGVGIRAGAGAVANGAVPLMSSSQAYAIACCVLLACFSAFSTEFSSILESSDSDVSSAASPVMKRPRDEEESESDDGEEDECVTNVADVKDSRRERKRARLGVHEASSVHFGQAKKKSNNNNNNNNNHKRHTKSNDSCNSPCFSSSEVVSDDSIVCSPTASISSGAASPKELSPFSMSPSNTMASSLFSTLPPEMACDFEAEHALYFHGIACPNSNASPMMSAPMTLVHPCAVSTVASSPVMDSPVFDHTPRVTGIDPALLMEPSEEHEEVDEDDDETEESTAATVAAATSVPTTASAVANAPLFGIALEPFVQDVFYC